MKRGISYVCRECGFRTAKWLGKCPSCGTFDSIEIFEEKVHSTKRNFPRIEFLSIDKVDFSYGERLKTGINEFDSVLGGGIVPGSAILISGEPGIGKSTLLLQVANSVSRAGSVIYVTGEESFEQVALRAKRLGIASDRLFVVAEPNILKVLDNLERENPVLLIADSVQTLYSDELDSPPGSLVQVREVASRLVRFAKETTIPVIMIGHITKEGSIAGPKLLEHLVDTVIYFEGDQQNFFRILRTTKNRFGATDEIGVFEMSSSGLIPVSNPSAAFLANALLDNSVVYPALEGTRVILTEIQSIVSPTFYANPRRTSSGVDPIRLSIIVAVLETRAGISFSGCDIFLTTSSGLKVKETAVDLPLAISLYLSLSGKKSGVLAAFGELGLDGSVRQIFQPELRIKEVERFGIKKIIIPDYDRINHKTSEGVELIRVKSLIEALEAVE